MDLHPPRPPLPKMSLSLHHLLPLPSPLAQDAPHGAWRGQAQAHQHHSVVSDPKSGTVVRRRCCSLIPTSHAHGCMSRTLRRTYSIFIHGLCIFRIALQCSLLFQLWFPHFLLVLHYTLLCLPPPSIIYDRNLKVCNRTRAVEELLQLLESSPSWPSWHSSRPSLHFGTCSTMALLLHSSADCM